MKIVFYMSKSGSDKFQHSPLGIGYLAAYVKREVKDCVVVVARDVDEIIKEKPDILAISSISLTIYDTIEVSEKVKSLFPNTFIVLGGYHITLLPHKLPKSVDIGVIGEGESTLLELVRLVTNQKINLKDLKNVKGICFRHNNKIVQTKPRDFIKDLDSLPHPIRVPYGYAGIVGIFTSRGCPYSCYYCASSSFWKRNFRVHSAQYVVEELLHIIKTLKPHTIHILDDLFLADKKRFSELHKLVIKNKIHKKVAFRAFVRANLIDEPTIKKMKEMNFVLIRFGAETGSERLLRLLKGGSVTVKDGQRTINLCHKYKIPSAASFMFGAPGETREDLMQTYNFIKRNKNKNFSIDGFYFLTPYPGTKFWDYAKSKGKVNDDMDLRRLDILITSPKFSWDKVIYLNEKINFEDFKKIIDKFYKNFLKTETQFVNIINFLSQVDLLKRVIGKGVRLRRWALNKLN